MKNFLSLVLIITTISLIGCAPPKPASGLPDLIVSDIRVTGTPIVNTENKVEVPLQVTVRNIGLTDAGGYKVSVDYIRADDRQFVVAFTVPGHPSIWYPQSDSLRAGNDVTYTGILTFHPSVHGENVSLIAMADSCSGDEFLPEHCRVAENSESNNESSAVDVFLP